MKPKLGALQAMFPDISMTVLQERLAAAEGHLPNAVKVMPSCKASLHREASACTCSQARSDRQAPFACVDLYAANVAGIAL